METRVFTTSEEDIAEAGRVLARGGLVAFPTETVYGLGADAMNGAAVKAVYAAKGRPSDNPMIVHIADFPEIEKLTPRITPLMKCLMEAFWPGPMTLVVPKVAGIPDETTGGLDTVGIRMPSDPVAREFIRKSGCPIAAPSANTSGRPSPTRADHVLQDMDGKIHGIIRGGDCQVGIESTVIDVTGSNPVILRPGIITKDQIQKAVAGLGCQAEIDPALLSQGPQSADFKPKAPGMKYRHYAPKAEMFIVSGGEDAVNSKIQSLKEEYEMAGKKVGVLLFKEGDLKAAAHDFFKRLRDFDDDNTDVILAGALSQEDGVGFAVMNRMLKSAGYSIIEA